MRAERGGDREVAVEDQLQPARDGDAVDQGDGRERQSAQPPEDAVELGDEVREGHRVLLEGEVRGEVAARR